MNHTHTYEGKALALCRCGKCDGTWWTLCPQEFAPSFCCYCGMKFSVMTWDEGKTMTNLAGFPVKDDETP